MVLRVGMKPEEILPGLRALIAKRLVEKHGFPKKRVAEILGLSPPAVTLYLQGKRAEEITKLLSQEKVLKLIDDFVEYIVDKGGRLATSELYDLAFDVIAILEKETVNEDLTALASSADRKKLRRLLNELKARIEVEQKASEDFMRVASKINNNLVRMIIRMIARDCIKHSDLLSTIVQIMESGGKVEVDVIDRKLLMDLLTRERKYHVEGFEEVKELTAHPLIKMVVDFIESDEHKHEGILRDLLNYLSSFNEEAEKMGKSTS